MGTNFYLQKKSGWENLHICKLSAGFSPLFQEQEQFDSIRGLLKFVTSSPGWKIVDEYGIDYSPYEFFLRVENHVSMFPARPPDRNCVEKEPGFYFLKMNFF